MLPEPHRLAQLVTNPSVQWTDPRSRGIDPRPHAIDLLAKANAAEENNRRRETENNDDASTFEATTSENTDDASGFEETNEENTDDRTSPPPTNEFQQAILTRGVRPQRHGVKGIVAKRHQTKYSKPGKIRRAKPKRIAARESAINNDGSEYPFLDLRIENEQDMTETRAYKREGGVVEDDYAHQDSELQAHKTKKTNEWENFQG
jgi:hypothetical protein